MIDTAGSFTKLKATLWPFIWTESKASNTDGMKVESIRRNMEYSIDRMKIEEIIVECSIASVFYVNLLEHPRSIEKSLEFPASVSWRKMEDCKPLQEDDTEFPDLELANCLQTEIEVKCHIRTYSCSCGLVACENQVDERKMNINNVETIALVGTLSERLNWNIVKAIESNWNIAMMNESRIIAMVNELNDSVAILGNILDIVLMVVETSVVAAKKKKIGGNGNNRCR